MESTDCQEGQQISSSYRLLLVTVNFPQPPKTSHHWHQLKRKKQRDNRGQTLGWRGWGWGRVMGLRLTSIIPAH